MRALLCISAVLTISLISGCGSMNRADSNNMLESRSAYRADGLSELSLNERGVEGFKEHPTPTRTRAKIAAVYVHPHEMPNHDYFWGAWLSVVIDEDHWVMSKPQLVPKAKAFKNALPLLERN